MSTSGLSCAGNQEFLVFVVSIIPKAETTEVEITHSIKNTARKLHNLWDYLERKKDPHSPHNLVWVLVSLYTSAATEKSKRKIYFLTFLCSIKCSYTHKILTYSMNMRWLFSSKFLKLRGTNTRSFMHWKSHTTTTKTIEMASPVITKRRKDLKTTLTTVLQIVLESIDALAKPEPKDLVRF